MNKIHDLIHKCHNPNLGIFLIRLALGAVFIHAGYGKLQMLSEVVAGFGSMGIPAWLAYVVAYSEFLGGIAMILGIFVRYFGVILAIIMLVAFWKVHLPNRFSIAN